MAASVKDVAYRAQNFTDSGPHCAQKLIDSSLHCVQKLTDSGPHCAHEFTDSGPHCIQNPSIQVHIVYRTHQFRSTLYTEPIDSGPHCTQNPPIQVHTREGAPVAPVDHTVRVEHGHDLHAHTHT